MSRTRQTTSVSTLVNDIQEVVIYAHKNAPAIMKEVIALHSTIAKLATDYNTLRATVNDWQGKCGLVAEASVSIDTILAIAAAKEAEASKK